MPYFDQRDRKAIADLVELYQGYIPLLHRDAPADISAIDKLGAEIDGLARTLNGAAIQEFRRICALEK